MNLFIKQKQTHSLRELTYGYLEKSDIQGVWDGHGHTAIFKMDNLLQSTWNSAQCYVADWMGGGFQGEQIYEYV